MDTDPPQRSPQRHSDHRATPLWLALALVACGSDGGGATAESETGGVDGSSSDTGAPSWPPAVCDLDASPFLSAPCLGALRSACGMHPTESDCAAELPLGFDDGGYTVRCGWAKVVHFADADACTVATVAGRCEATLETECGNACAGEFMNSDLGAMPGEGELIELCGGPLGPWSAVDSEEPDAFGTCAPDVTPPAPALCDCASVACAAG